MASIQTKERNGKAFYYIVARDPEKGRNGQRWHYAGTDPAQAEIRLREVELALAKGESLRRRKESPRFSALSGEFLKYAQGNLSPETAERYERSLAILKGFLRDDPPMDRITPTVLEGFKVYRQKVRYHTLRNDFVALQSLYTWTKRLGYCETAPTDKITLRNSEKQRPTRFLREARKSRLFGTAPLRSITFVL